MIILLISHYQFYWFIPNNPDEALNKSPKNMILEYLSEKVKWDLNNLPTRGTNESSDCYHTNSEQFIK